jgi:SAM-dependent methyltransferase
VSEAERVLDVGTGGGEVFSQVARAGDVALDISLEMLGAARERLSCHLVAGDREALPFGEGWFDVVADRHVGVDPREVLRVLVPGGVYVTQQVGGRNCQSIFDAFGWGSNREFWVRECAETGLRYWDVGLMAESYGEAGCEIVRREESDVEYEFLDVESLAFWLMNAPLPERVDADRHGEVLDGLSLCTNWHSELLVVRRGA